MQIYNSRIYGARHLKWYPSCGYAYCNFFSEVSNVKGQKGKTVPENEVSEVTYIFAGRYLYIGKM